MVEVSSVAGNVEHAIELCRSSTVRRRICRSTIRMLRCTNTSLHIQTDTATASVCADTRTVIVVMQYHCLHYSPYLILVNLYIDFSSLSIHCTHNSRRFCASEANSFYRSSACFFSCMSTAQSQQCNCTSSACNNKTDQPFPPTQSTSNSSILQRWLASTRRTSCDSNCLRSKSSIARRHKCCQCFHNLLSVGQLRGLEDDTLNSAPWRVECGCQDLTSRIGCGDDLPGGYGRKDEFIAEAVCCRD
jgi:hypothetical protein